MLLNYELLTEFKFMVVFISDASVIVIEATHSVPIYLRYLGTERVIGFLGYVSLGYNNLINKTYGLF